ncbi:MAG: glycerophosphodiester phosphodiesterase [Ignisphaera sp.]
MSWRNNLLIIAHRGASAYEPENTLTAFRRAVAMGTDAVEFDVRRSKDGVPVVVHDEDLKRIAGVDKRVSDLTLEELKKIKVLGREFIPTLDEVLSEFGNKIPLFVEVKDEGIEDKITESIKVYGVYDNVLIISFNYNVLAKIKETLSRIDVGLLTYRYPLPLSEAVKLKAFALLPRYNIVNPRTVKELHAKNLKVYTWTINDASIALKVISYGVDGFATDNPLIKSYINKQKKLTKLT